MSLFVCEKCGCVENSNLVNDDKIETKYNITLPESMQPYPHMHLIDMMGSYGKDIIVNNVVWKKADDIMMLCSECNTGIWHNEFKKEPADEEDLELSKYSKWNYTTPGDHERGAIFSPLGSNDSYKLHSGYKELHRIFRELFNKQEHDHILDFKDNYFPHLYSIFIEDVKNFYPSGNQYLEVDWSNEREVLNYAISCLVYEKESKSRTLQTLHTKIYGRNFYTTHSDPYITMANLVGLASGYGRTSEMEELMMKMNAYKKRHGGTKPVQSEEEKNMKLQKAAEKRQRKLDKKQKLPCSGIGYIVLMDEQGNLIKG